jgi:hypothetical protein
MRLGLFFMRFNQANRGALRQQSEKFLVVLRIEFEPRVKFQHLVRILRSIFRRFVRGTIVGAGLACPESDRRARPALRLSREAALFVSQSGRSKLRPCKLQG